MNRNYAIEIDGSIFHLSGSLIKNAGTLAEIENCRFLVSDLERSITRVMTVESDFKYTEAVVVRTLQEEGEFDEPVSVITHWKKKQGKNSTQIFFTALPSRIYFNYLDTIREHDHLLILIPVFSVLANLTRQVCDKNPVAVIFRHHRFADIVIGDPSQFFFATRCVAFDTGQEQIQSLWQTVDREISQAAIDHSIRIEQLISLRWIDAPEDPASIHLQDIKCSRFFEKSYVYGDQLHSTALGNALNMFSPLDGIAPPYGRFFYYTEKLSGFLIVILALAIAALAWGTLSCQTGTKDLKQNITTIENRLDRMKDSMVLPDNQPRYADSLAFIDQMLHSRYLPSYKDIINSVSKGVPPSTQVTRLTIDYQGRTVRVGINGVIDEDFDEAYKGYQDMVTRLSQDGFKIENNQFQTRIDASKFELTLTWSLQ